MRGLPFLRLRAGVRALNLKIIGVCVVLVIIIAIGLYAFYSFTPQSYTTTLTAQYGQQGVIVASPGPPAP
jgi:hypothetical protein